jgi:acetyl-CoA C-acetyltransferase
MKHGDVYILSAARTPTGKFGGSLAGQTAADIGVIAAKAAIERAGVNPAQVDELIFGNGRQAGGGPNVARQVAWRAGLGPPAAAGSDFSGVAAYTVNQACASGMKAIVLGWEDILLGQAELVVAGGTESMSRLPYYVEARWGFRLGHQPLVDAMYRDGFLCPLSQMIMGETAELLATQYKIPREEQDLFALRSHQRAEAAMKACRFKDEIVAVEVTDRKGNKQLFETEEHVRQGAELAAMAKLPPVFSKTGTITAGNSSGITDAAAALVLASEDFARRHDLKPLARLLDSTTAAVDPKIMGIGPVPAVRRLLERNGWKVEDFDLVELNEAFAAQVLACDRELHFDPEKLNVNGGAIALGHPIGCTGARITTTLVHELRRPPRRGRLGLATLCVSGGMGMTLAIESVT